MAKYQDKSGNIIEVGDATLNPDLVKGMTQISDAPNYATDAITSETMAPTPSSNFKNPNALPIYPVASLDSTPPATLTQPQGEAQKISDRLQELSKATLGEAAFKAEQAKLAGIPELNKTQTDLASKLKGIQNEALAIPLQLQNDANGRGITSGGLTPIQTAALRNNAIAALSVSSLLETSRGNIANAQAQVDAAVSAKYDPIKEEIRVAKENYDLIIKSPQYSASEKKQAAAEKQAADDRQRTIEKEENATKEIYNTGLTALKYGADAATVALIQKAKTPQEAIQIGAKFLQDPKDKMELETARIENILKRAQATKIEAETKAIGQPTAAEKKAQAEAIKNVKTMIPALQDKVTMIDGLLTSTGLAGSVGPNFMMRLDPINFITADKQNFIAGVEQITSKETLDALLSLKAQGGTLGALSDGERIALQSAASKIGSWRKEENGKVTGYEASEKDFKAELETLKRLTQRAIQNASGTLFDAGEQAMLDEAYQGGTTNEQVIDGKGFYNN